MCFQLDYERGNGIGGASWGGARNVLGLWAFVCDGSRVAVRWLSSVLLSFFQLIFVSSFLRIQLLENCPKITFSRIILVIVIISIAVVAAVVVIIAAAA